VVVGSAQPPPTETGESVQSSARRAAVQGSGGGVDVFSNLAGEAGEVVTYVNK